MTARGVVSDPKPSRLPGGYDPGRRRISKREGRERGCWIYIPAEELRAADRLGPDAPRYRVWGRGRGSVLVRIYK